MKFSKYVMLAGAAALLTACSSEEPVNGGQQDVANGDEMYLAINVVGNDTRAEATQEGSTEENAINALRIFILDENENLYFCKEAEDVDEASGTGTFTVTTATFNDMKAKLERGAQMKIVVYANGPEDIEESEDILHGKTDATTPTWGIQTAAGKNDLGFIMSNAEEVIGEFDAPTADATGKDKAHAWVIKSDIKLARLATRFEYGSDNKASYTAQHETGVKMTIEGFSVTTHATTTYRIPQFTADGKEIKPGEFTAENHTHYKATSAFPYRMTESVPATAVRQYDALTYGITPSNKTTYARPNTISKGTALTGKTEDYQKVPFAAVKAAFTCPDFAGTGVESASMKDGEDVYAIEGVFIGGFKDFLALRALGTQFKVNVDPNATFSDSEKETIAQIEANYNRLLKMTLPSEYGNQDLSDEAWFKQGLGKVDTYKRNKDGKYYTYYASLIYHEKDNADVAWKYGVSRNTSYALTVNSFKFLGNSGNGRPGEGPTGAELTDMALQFSVSVNPWNLNIQNNWDL